VHEAVAAALALRAAVAVAASWAGHPRPFAPHHQQAADELIRVCRPGGTIGLLSWTPEGFIGRLFATMKPYVAPPPPGVSSPPLWGSEDHVRGLLGDRVTDVVTERRGLPVAMFATANSSGNTSRPTRSDHRGLPRTRRRRDADRSTGRRHRQARRRRVDRRVGDHGVGVPVGGGHQAVTQPRSNRVFKMACTLALKPRMLDSQLSVDIPSGRQSKCHGAPRIVVHSNGEVQ
jgi:hypothetical protein